MFLVNLPRTWPRVLRGLASAEDVTLGEWARVSEGSLTRYGDSVVGVYKNQVVSAYDITGWHRTTEGRIVFEGQESATLAHLIGQPVPGERWVQGAVRPVKTLDTRLALGEEVSLEPTADGLLRAVLGDTVVSVTPDGAVTVRVGAGRPVTVIVNDAATAA